MKEWRVTKSLAKVAAWLIIDRVSFSYTEEDGITFSAPEHYVIRLSEKLGMTAGVKVQPLIQEL